MSDRTDQERVEDGMAVRRAVLGDAHVDRAGAGTTDFTADFQDFITRYAWGDIWSRPGLERRMRSAVTLTALIAHGHFEELAMHVRGALKNGLTQNEIKEIILQSAVYCGVPAANSAFRVAQEVLSEPLLTSPVRDEPAVDEPGVDKPAVDRPGVDKPAAELNEDG
jgi:4-carboxymuconolactone decarboxylase